MARCDVLLVGGSARLDVPEFDDAGIEPMRRHPCDPPRYKIRLESRGGFLLKGATIQMEDGTTIAFSNIAVSGVVITGEIIPEFRDGQVTIYTPTSPTDAPTIVEKDHGERNQGR